MPCETSIENTDLELDKRREHYYLAGRHVLGVSGTHTEYMPTPHQEENTQLGEEPIITV